MGGAWNRRRAYRKALVDDTVLEGSTYVVLALGVENLLEAGYQFADVERLSLHLIVLIGGELVDTYAEQGGELSEILLGHDHFLVAQQHVGRVLGQWVYIFKLCQCHLVTLDRKSTRLNSSHANISYAVFCLKKKKKNSHH